jgi:hypothetical protein
VHFTWRAASRSLRRKVSAFLSARATLGLFPDLSEIRHRRSTKKKLLSSVGELFGKSALYLKA